jgi:site-specific DNA recombinase
MMKASKPIPDAADSVWRRAVIYARVSSKEQEKEGFSISAQLKLLKEYAAANGFAVAQQYIDVETAKQTGRTAFGEMIAHLNAQPSIRILLVEKTDRLYRNLKDWVTVDDLEVEIHFVKEGVVLSRGSRSSEKFMHGIKVLMAKNYIDNLSEEARKGMQEKAEQGIWPTKCPLGYRNVSGSDGKKIIATDPAIAPLIAKLFEWYGRGDISLKEAARKAHAAGLAYPRSGAKVPVSTIHTILRNRLYTGWFEWNGKLIQGQHEALVPVELWERVQDVIDGRFSKNSRRGRRDFAFSGLISCKQCGCAVVGEMSTRRPLGAIRPNTSGCRSGSTPCMSISSMALSTPPSSRKCQSSGATSRTSACARSNATKAPTNPTWKRACSFSNSRETPKSCSNSKNRAKNAVC